VIDSVPGIFTVNTTGQGAIINQDQTPNSRTNAAAPESVVSIYATGEGQTSPAGADGAINGGTLPLPAPLLPVSVQIGGLPAQVMYAGAAPLEVAGVLQVNVVVPAGVPTGPSVPVVITVGTASSQTGVTIAIHP
jgi:trimeric autotransporter adhesin